MVYTFARINAVLKMKVCDYFVQGRRGWVRLRERGGKEHEAPCHHNLEQLLDEYIDATGITAYLKNSGKLEVAQHIANHESPRATKLYDRRQDEIRSMRSRRQLPEVRKLDRRTTSEWLTIHSLSETDINHFFLGMWKPRAFFDDAGRRGRLSAQLANQHLPCFGATGDASSVVDEHQQ